MTLQFSILVLHLRNAHIISVVHKKVNTSFHAYDFDNEESLYVLCWTNSFYLVNEQANKLLSSSTAQLHFEGMLFHFLKALSF